MRNLAVLDAGKSAAKVDGLMASLALTGINVKLQPVSSGIAIGSSYELPPVHRRIIAPFGTIAYRATGIARDNLGKLPPVQVAIQTYHAYKGVR